MCVSQNTTTVIIASKASIRERGKSLNDYKCASYYLLLGQTGRWNMLLKDPPGHDWSSYSTGLAKRFRGIIKYSDNKTHITWNIDTTKGNVSSDGGCYLISFWCWVIGHDYRIGNFLICQNEGAAPGTAANVSTAGTRLGVAVVSRETTPDDWFRVTTGISGQTNNWLLMVEQAANLAETDCVICMGLRPVLRVIPATVLGQCVIDLMNNTVPTKACRLWDAIFPLAGPVKSKPLFSKDVAQGNFTCVSLTGSGERLRSPSSVTCNETVIATRTFRPQRHLVVVW